MWPGPMALRGLGPNFGQKDWAHGLHCKVEVHGPNGPRDLMPYIYIHLISPCFERCSKHYTYS